MAWREDRGHPQLLPHQERRGAAVHLSGHPVPPVRLQYGGRRDAVRLAVAAVALLAVATPPAPQAARPGDDQSTFSGYPMQAPLPEYPALKFLQRSATEFF